MVELGRRFGSLAEAKEVITREILDEVKSYRVYKSDSTRLVLNCHNAGCSFRIRVTYSKVEEWAKVTVVRPHNCSPLVHQKNRAASGMRYLKPKYRAAILDQRGIKPGK